MTPLDDRDRRLLAALRANARLSVVALAREAGLSRSATRERVRRLERAGVIEGYGARVREDAAAGAAGARAWLLLTHRPGHRCRHTMPRLRALPFVGRVYSLAGAVDLLVEVEFGAPAELRAIAERVGDLPGVASVSSHLVLRQG